MSGTAGPGQTVQAFRHAHAMTASVIEDVIQRFAHTARLGEQAGFTGVEIHAAHGYLLSQFLSPLTNQRTDEWAALCRTARGCWSRSSRQSGPWFLQSLP
ncbi:hypothetical protein V5O39_06820 [Pseudomonas parakoreensis]